MHYICATRWWSSRSGKESAIARCRSLVDVCPVGLIGITWPTELFSWLVQTTVKPHWDLNLWKVIYLESVISAKEDCIYAYTWKTSQSLSEYCAKNSLHLLLVRIFFQIVCKKCFVGFIQVCLQEISDFINKQQLMVFASRRSTSAYCYNYSPFFQQVSKQAFTWYGCSFLPLLTVKGIVSCESLRVNRSNFIKDPKCFEV